MEKITLKEKIQRGLTAVWDAVKAHPVEIVILLYICVVGCYGISNPDVFDVRNEPVPWWFRPLVLAPFMVVAAYSLQPFRKRGTGWLLLYLLPLVVMVAGFAMPFLLDWVEVTTYWIAVLAALPLWMCVRHRLTDNEPFVQRNVQMAWSLARALLIAGILYLLYAAIAYTITSLFDIRYKTWNGWYGQVALLLFCGLAPVLFFAMEDRPEPIEIRRFWAVLLNWVLTPALMIYTVVLYVYAAKILFTWNLPKGGVAIMVTVFFVIFFAAKILQMLTEPQPLKWFYDHFSLFVLPLLALFWTAVARRLTDYGLTESRYYLLLGGVLMTVCAGVPLSQPSWLFRLGGGSVGRRVADGAGAAAPWRTSCATGPNPACTHDCQETQPPERRRHIATSPTRQSRYIASGGAPQTLSVAQLFVQQKRHGVLQT